MKKTDSSEFDDNSISKQRSNIENRSLGGYSLNESRDIFLIANSTMNETLPGHYLWRIDMKFDINTTKYQGKPVWLVNWIYKNQENNSQKEVIITIDGTNGDLLEKNSQ
jgi:hypothetical protein